MTLGNMYMHTSIGLLYWDYDDRCKQCSTFTGMRDLKESNNLHRRIKSGKLYHLCPIPLQVVQSN